MGILTEQEAFNKSVAGLASQGFTKSFSMVEGYKYGEAASCLYRNGDKRCAIGWLITDEEYLVEFEGYGVDHILSESYELKSIRDLDERFLERLQMCHDESESPEDMKKRLRAFAGAHNLELPKELAE